VLFGSILVTQKRYMPKLSVSLTYIPNAVIKTLYSTILTRGEQLKNISKPVKECFDIQARGPQQREAPGICPVCPMVNPALDGTRGKKQVWRPHVRT